LAGDPAASAKEEAIAQEAASHIEAPSTEEAENQAPPAAHSASDDIPVEGVPERKVDPQGFGGGVAPDLAAIIDRLPVGVVVHRDGVAVALNKTLLDLLGHESIDEFEAHGGIEKLFVERGEKEAAHPGVAIRSRDGEIIAVDARCQSIKWNGEAATLLSLRRSLTSQTKALEASFQVELDAKQAEIDDLRTILEGAIDGVVTVDALGRILAMNDTAERLFGYGAVEIAGEALAILAAPEAHHLVTTALANAKETGSASHVEAQDVTGREREGRRIPLSMRLFGAGANRTSARFYAVFADLTAAKNSEAALIEARVSAERSTAQKSEFLAKVSHEIRTPLNSIVGFADIIAEERFGPLANERYKEYLRDIRASGTHIISLVNDLLDLSKIEAGRMELAFTNVSLNAEVSGAVALIQAEAARSRVLMRQSLAQSLPAIVADQRSVKQIVINIVSNAVKFTEPGGQVIVSTAFSDKGEVILRVRDTGIGMSERELAEAMEPFRQFATTQRPGGSGLGLSLTKALVKANKANISISSATNEGTLVEIVFPKESVIAI
jgi:PAS domain S-box-containing protein